MGRLEGKAAIVTGAASGIGRASARLFAREGARVLAVDREAGALDETVGSIGAEGGTAIAFVADTGDEAAVKAYVARAIEAFGTLEAIYANAGISGGLIPLFEQSVEHWTEVLRVNLIGPFLAIKYSAPEMIARGKGSIVLTASVAGLRANAGGNPYSASKAGVISLAQTSANSLIGTGVRVNAICPGLIETGMTRSRSSIGRARQRDGGQDRPTQPAAARGRPGGDRRDGAVPGERRSLLRERTGVRGRRRAVEHASLRRAEAVRGGRR